MTFHGADRFFISIYRYVESTLIQTSPTDGLHQ
jgi:hypothetical protein